MKSQDTLREEMVKTVAESLEAFGFQYAIRNCRTPKYGEDAYTEERWSAETLGAFISDDILKLVEAEKREAVQGFAKNLKSIEYPPSGKEYHFQDGSWNNDLSSLTAPEQTEKTTGGGANE